MDVSSRRTAGCYVWPQAAAYTRPIDIGTDLIKDLPEEIISRILGHRDPRSTRRYADVIEDQMRVARARLRRQ